MWIAWGLALADEVAEGVRQGGLTEGRGGSLLADCPPATDNRCRRLAGGGREYWEAAVGTLATTGDARCERQPGQEGRSAVWCHCDQVGYSGMFMSSCTLAQGGVIHGGSRPARRLPNSTPPRGPVQAQHGAGVGRFRSIGRQRSSASTSRSGATTRWCQQTRPSLRSCRVAGGPDERSDDRDDHELGYPPGGLPASPMRTDGASSGHSVGAGGGAPARRSGVTSGLLSGPPAWRAHRPRRPYRHVISVPDRDACGHAARSVGV